ncbi:MAG: flagellar basal-body rod protein FlgF [Alphaproteobacteria bacterium]
MTNTIYVTLARQMLLRNEMDVVAQNIANASTTAYKGERILFEEHLYQSADGSSVSYVVEAGTKRDHAAGRIERTGNDLDVAVNGDGYFVVDGKNGPAYTRQGHFQLDGKGTLVTSSGAPVLDANSRPIVIGRASHVTIGRDGTIATDRGPLGRIQLVEIENEDQLQRLGEGLFAYGGEPPKPMQPEEVDLQQGALEASNVSPIVEMTRMIELVRSYQSAQRMMDTDNELLRKSIQEMTAVK